MLRVASVPASHVYVRHLADPAGVDAVRRLSDPVPRDGRKVPGGWWPPLMLEPGWVSENRNRFEVFHVHFGFDAIAPEDLREVVDELTRHNKPLVYTVPDLRNRGLMSATANAGQPCCKRGRQRYPRGLRRPRGYSTFRIGYEPPAQPMPTTSCAMAATRA